MCLDRESDAPPCAAYADFMLASAIAKAVVGSACVLGLWVRLTRLMLYLWRCGQLKVSTRNAVTKRRTQTLAAIGLSVLATAGGQSYDILVYRLGQYYAVQSGECARNRTAFVDEHTETLRASAVLVAAPMNMSTSVVLLFVFLLWLDLVEQASMESCWRKRAVLVFVGVVSVVLTTASVDLAFLPDKVAPSIITGTLATYVVHGTLLYYSSMYGPVFAKLLLKMGNTSSKASSQKIGGLIRTNARFILLGFCLVMSAGITNIFQPGISRCSFQVANPFLLFLAWVYLMNASIMYFETAESTSSTMSRVTSRSANRVSAMPPSGQSCTGTGQPTNSTITSAS